MGWDTRYAIGRLLAERAAALGVGKPAIVRALGHRNLNRGLRRLERFLASGAEREDWKRRLASVLEVPETALEAGCAETRREIAAEQQLLARWRFRPHVRVETAGRRRYPAFAYAFAAAHKTVAVPEPVQALPVPRQVRRVGRLVRRHFLEHHGELPVFGRITGYVFHVSFDRAIALDVDGTIREPYAAPAREPGPALLVKGRAIPRSLIHDAQG